MKEERDGIYRNASIKPVLLGFLVIIFIALIAGLLFFRSGHPAMPVTPQPKNNKGALAIPGNLRES